MLGGYSVLTDRIRSSHSLSFLLSTFPFFGCSVHRKDFVEELPLVVRWITFYFPGAQHMADGKDFDESLPLFCIKVLALVQQMPDGLLTQSHRLDMKCVGQ